MTVRNSYIAVEGAQDVAFVAALIKPSGFQPIRKKSDVPEFWHQLIPKSFPPDGDDILRRVPIPIFFRKSDEVVAVQAAGGDTRLAERAMDSLEVLAPLDALAIVLDTDAKKTAAARFKAVRQALAERGLAAPTKAGSVVAGPPRCGIYVLPDNKSPGTLESLLLKCAEVSYPKLLRSAHRHVKSVDHKRYKVRDMEEFIKPSGRSKATVAAIGGVLRPGSAIQVSIQHTTWLDGAARELPAVAAFSAFLSELLAG